MTPVLALKFSASHWIWTNKLVGGNAPVGSCAFRRDFYSPPGKSAVSANVILVVDNEYELYVNGAPIFTGSYFFNSQAYWYSLTTPDAWQYPVLNDSSWPEVVIEGQYGMSPWGDIPVDSGLQNLKGAASDAPEPISQPSDQEPLYI